MTRSTGNEPHKDEWRCPYCGWSGESAPVNASRWEVECPKCEAMIDDSIAELLEEHSDWERSQ